MNILTKIERWMRQPFSEEWEEFFYIEREEATSAYNVDSVFYVIRSVTTNKIVGETFDSYGGAVAWLKGSEELGALLVEKHFTS